LCHRHNGAVHPDLPQLSHHHNNHYLGSGSYFQAKIEKLFRRIAEAREEIRKGEYVTLDELSY
jgi:hypothetical protein